MTAMSESEMRETSSGLKVGDLSRVLAEASGWGDTGKEVLREWG
jgi:hypothetical protein